jgi:hypothetical protein
MTDDRPGTPDTAVPPRIAPDKWEDSEGFRETTLVAITDPNANAAARAVGQLFYAMVLQFDEFGHASFCHQVGAALADLRFLEGRLEHLGHEHQITELNPEDTHLSRGCLPLAARVRKIADALERRVGVAEEASALARLG